MSISLVKGQKVNLAKESGEELENVFVGLGWDFVPGQTIDLDAFCMLLTDSKIASKGDCISYTHLKHKSGSVRHTGDNLTGEGNGDDERIVVDLKKVPEQYNKIVFAVNIFGANLHDKTFSTVQNAFIRIVNKATGEEFLRYDLGSGDYDDVSTVVFGEVYRHNGQWKFNALGQGIKAKSIGETIKMYQ